MVDKAAQQKITDYISIANDEGSVILSRKEREDGYYVPLTIVEGITPKHHLAREEIFGPVLALVEVDDLDSALEFVNGSRYGNASVIFTASGEAVRRFRYEVEAGMVGVNVGVPAPVAWFPFAGWKDSMVGDLHANGHDAVEFYTRKKVVTTRWQPAKKGAAFGTH